MQVIGLTGGIASGKSTVSKLLKKMGAMVIDADIVSREIMVKGTEAYNKIVEYFGKEILKEDGEIDRKKLGNIVFADRRKLKKLNEITHPIIIERIKEKIEEERKKNQQKAIVLDAALLIEMKLYKMVDEVWLVVVDSKTQIKRIMERDKLSYKDAINRIKSQMPLDEKMKYADFIINNSKDFKAMEKQVTLFWGRFVT
ncbi:dephospho-CoA kinase [Thermoanaerobacter uzonensis DSM 18761]|uniref:Dephospho-CoA kinase n=1 Tax=Thermoanaerobacter uzonensis DSM 18761 TaxID=1123369 RepID=A0A1M4Z247_9THEO|nr:dephospho-CoA kinase [Thermoanaerobacter uzonensis]SHF12153.1 dephospho-CoA kinase [Thermoanaerobacter uzonensis DSM 18761]